MRTCATIGSFQIFDPARVRRHGLQKQAHLVAASLGCDDVREGALARAVQSERQEEPHLFFWGRFFHIRRLEAAEGEEEEEEEMKAFSVLHAPKQLLFELPTMPILVPPTSVIRLRVKLFRQLNICQAKSVADHDLDGSSTFTTVSSSLLTAEKEEAKAVLSLFLRKLGLSNATTARTINKSDRFIRHLISRLHSVHKSRYLVGRELTTLEIREALVPYLESLLEEHGEVLVDIVENFPNPPGKEKSSQSSPPSVNLDVKKQKALSKVSNLDSDGQLPIRVRYLLGLGFDHGQIKDMVRRFPSFAYYSLDGKIKPVVEFLIQLGVSESDIPSIIFKRPQLCGISFSENLMPMMKYLESFGVDKRQWAKVIYRFPALLTYSRQKVKASVDYLAELGISAAVIGKILTRCPHIVSYSVEDKLRPTGEYFESLGVSAAVLLQRAPQAFGLSIEANLKPVTEFFLEKGFTMEEVTTIVSRYGTLYTFSLAENVHPKWEFFLTTDYKKSDLVKFPQYFGYKLEERIKPRYKHMKELGVRLLLNQLLSTSDAEFEKILEKKLKKLADER